MGNSDSIKRCSRCKKSKDRSEFSRSGRSKDGLQPWCRTCYAAYQRDAGHNKRLQEAYKKKHDDAFYQLAFSELRLKFCAGCGQAKSIKEFYKKRSGSDGFASYCRPCDVQNTGHRQQHGRCAICKRLPYTKKGLVVDHCHQTGAIRGILCSRCNSALGLLDDDPALLEQALEYLR
jgi:Recombination endonuclease VII